MRAAICKYGNLPIFRYGLIALAGLTLDIVVFQTLVSLAGWVFLANVISAGCAVTFVYFASLHTIFTESKACARRFSLFVAYYAVSIAFFSWVIDALTLHLALLPLVAKLITVPASFLMNYFFAGKIIPQKKLEPHTS